MVDFWTSQNRAKIRDCFEEVGRSWRLLKEQNYAPSGDTYLSKLFADHQNKFELNVYIIDR